MSSSSSSAESSPSRHPRTSRRARKDPTTPQQKIDEFWANFKTKAPGKASSIIPQNEFAERAAQRASAKSKAPAKTTEQSYEAAAEQCRRKVAQIVKECLRVNQKYRDPHFDLEIDQKLNRRDCLDSLDNERDDHRCYGRGSRGGRSSRRRQHPHKDRNENEELPPKTPKSASAAGGVLGLLSALDKENAKVQSDGDGDTVFRPMAVKRVVDIFDHPQFFIDGPTANDVRQGRDGDCWLMAALCTLSNKPGLIERCCVEHNQEVGVYGFVFHRDGEWFSEIIDDKLYLTKPDYDESLFERILWEDRDRVNSEEAYRKIYQSNSGSLYFAQCENPNETWLPLLEKAYAKAHGDYSAIEGGYGGEGIEDLTGGVTSEIYTTDILDKEHFWNEELMKVNQDFLFGCSTGVWGRGWGERKGIVELHAYSVLKAREIDGVRLVLLKNPWGKHEWKGPWSDGSKEWTAEWLQKLDHKFGDDGSFWISYDDLLRKYQAFDRTRLFGPEWKVSSIWTTLDVSWTLDYHDTKFAFSLSKSGPVVIVFSQLDERYFKGLEGQYRFELSFRVHKAGEEDYVVRSQNYYRMNRSVNVELDLEAGEYVVVVKIEAQRNDRIMPVEEVVRAHAKDRREKLLRIGKAYDVAHSKGKILETPEEKEVREAYEQRQEKRERKRVAKLIKADKQAAKKDALRERVKDRKAREKAEARAKAKAERKSARREARRKAEEEERKKKQTEEAGSGSGSEVEAAKKTVDDAPNEEPVKTDGSTVSNAKIKVVEDTRSGDAESSGKASERLKTEHNDVEKPETEDAATQTPTDEKHNSMETPPKAENQAEGSTSSTEPGEHTPTSSAASVKNAIEGDEDPQEDEDYVTAAEEDTDNVSGASTKEYPPTPKPSQPTASNLKTESTPDRVDVGVQTGPGLPLPPLPVRHGPPPPAPPPPPHLQGMYSPPPPPPGSHYGPPRGRPYGPPRGPAMGPRDLRHIPPHLRRAYASGGRIPVPASETELSTSDSDSELDDSVSEVSDTSEHEIDACLAEAHVRAARAAAATAAAAKTPASQSAPVADEPMDEFEKDPWNAVGVFGLRVYYKIPEQGEQEVVRLRVERPNPYVWDESSDEEADDEKADEGKHGDKEESKVLDVDDSAKDAVGEQPPTPSTEEPENKEDSEQEIKEEKTENVKIVGDAAVKVKVEGQQESNMDESDVSEAKNASQGG